MTFSIVAIDPEKEVIGSAVASKWTSVGGHVPFFRPGVGIVNIQNQAYALTAYKILDELQRTRDADGEVSDCIEHALGFDSHQSKRQCVVASIKGGLGMFTGDECHDFSHQKMGEHCAAAGNCLQSTDVVEAMVQAFEESAEHPFTERLLLALEAGQETGGDTRGQEAAAIKVFKYEYPIQDFYPIDLRVDSDDAPLERLRELYDIFGDSKRLVIK